MLSRRAVVAAIPLRGAALGSRQVGQAMQKAAMAFPITTKPAGRLNAPRMAEAISSVWAPLFTTSWRAYATKALSPTMTAGTLDKWTKKVGDTISPGDVIATIETDKAVMDFESQEEGVLAKVLVEAGSANVPVNKVIAVLAEKQADIAAFADFIADEEAVGKAASTPAEPTGASASVTQPRTSAPAQESASTPNGTTRGGKPSSSPSTPVVSDRVLASPIARRLAEERGIDLSQVRGTGPDGRIIKEDVLAFKPASTPASAPAAAAATQAAPSEARPTAAAYKDIPLSNMRQVIARRLTESKQTVPHYYQTVDINMDKLLQIRESLNTSANGKFKLSVNDFIIKAAAKALLQVPEVNSAWQGDYIRQYHQADISVAVATSSGLITPIIPAAESKGLAGISTLMKSLAAKAQEGKLAPHEYQGGTFTISNLGMFGIREFTAIINPPQACILAVGSVEKRLIPSSKTPTGIDAASLLTVTLSCDHRVVDGAVGAQWLNSFRGFLEEPMTLLL